jgi:hypothetical protein
MVTTIYVYLLNEGTDTWRPVPAIKIDDSTYVLQGEDFYNSEDEEWEFLPGSRVRVKERLNYDGHTHLCAVEKAE